MMTLQWIFDTKNDLRIKPWTKISLHQFYVIGLNQLFDLFLSLIDKSSIKHLMQPCKTIVFLTADDKGFPTSCVVCNLSTYYLMIHKNTIIM